MTKLEELNKRREELKEALMLDFQRNNWTAIIDELAEVDLQIRAIETGEVE